MKAYAYTPPPVELAPVVRLELSAFEGRRLLNYLHYFVPIGVIHDELRALQLALLGVKMLEDFKTIG